MNTKCQCDCQGDIDRLLSIYRLAKQLLYLPHLYITFGNEGVEFVIIPTLMYYDTKHRFTSIDDLEAFVMEFVPGGHSEIIHRKFNL